VKFFEQFPEEEEAHRKNQEAEVKPAAAEEPAA